MVLQEEIEKPGQGEDAEEHACSEDEQESSVHRDPGRSPLSAHQPPHILRLGGVAEGFDQPGINTGNQGNGSPGHAWNHIGGAHAEPFKENADHRKRYHRARTVVAAYARTSGKGETRVGNCFGNLRDSVLSAFAERSGRTGWGCNPSLQSG